MGNTLRRNRPDDISAYYEIKNKIGSGNFATVKRGVRHLDGREFAIKVIKKSQITREELDIIDSEVAVMRTLQHRHVVRLFEIFETKKRIYIVMELLSGGELFDRIVQKGNFSEKEASEVIRDLASAIAYLHSIGVVHRDLKPENILYSSPSEDAVIKVTDFGLAKRSESDKNYMTTACGTPGYVAPEVLKGEPYDQSVDLWSLGVILYILLCGFPPFYSESTTELYRRIKNGEYGFPSPYWDEVSPPAIELIRGLLNVNPRERLTATQVLNHPWVCSGIARSQHFSQHHTNRIRLLQAKRKLRRNVQIIIACHRFSSILQVAAASKPNPNAGNNSATPNASPTHSRNPSRQSNSFMQSDSLTVPTGYNHNSTNMNAMGSSSGHGGHGGHGASSSSLSNFNTLSPNTSPSRYRTPQPATRKYTRHMSVDSSSVPSSSSVSGSGTTGTTGDTDELQPRPAYPRVISSLMEPLKVPDTSSSTSSNNEGMNGTKNSRSGNTLHPGYNTTNVLESPSEMLAGLDAKQMYNNTIFIDPKEALSYHSQHQPQSQPTNTTDTHTTTTTITGTTDTTSTNTIGVSNAFLSPERPTPVKTKSGNNLTLDTSLTPSNFHIVVTPTTQQPDTIRD